MRRFTHPILAALGIVSSCSKPDALSPAAFTSEFATALRDALPGLKVEIVKDLELHVTATNGVQTTSFLNNAYDTYKQEPASKVEIINRYVTGGLETIGSLQSPEQLDRTRIVPIIKDRPWLEETRKVMTDRGAKEVPDNVYEDLNSELVILYAEDSPKNIRYFGPKDLEKAHIGRAELRELACENLKRILPKIERRGADGLYMLTAGGDYEASLLLLNSVWDDLRKEVRGDIVVAIPTRDLLLVTGSQDAQGIAKIKQIMQKAFAEGSYRLTTKLFVFRDEKLVEFNP